MGNKRKEKPARKRERKEDLNWLMVRVELARLERETITYLNKHGAGIRASVTPPVYGPLPSGAIEDRTLQYRKHDLLKATAAILAGSPPSKLRAASYIAKSLPWLWSEFNAGRASWRFAAALAAAASEFPKPSTATRVTTVHSAEHNSKLAAESRKRKAAQHKARIHEMADSFLKTKSPHSVAAMILRKLDEQDLPASKPTIYEALRDHPSGHWKKK